MDAEHKHFLDTSVARSMFIGTETYRAYFEGRFSGGQCYVSPFVQMEFRRSCLRNIIAFFFVFDLPSITTYGDALKFWSNKFKTSEHKAVEQMTGELLNLQDLHPDRVGDKATAQLAVGMYVKRLDIKLRRKYKNVSTDSARCARAAVVPKVQLESMSADFRAFVTQFDDVATCRSKCRVDTFLLDRFRSPVEAFVKRSDSLPKNTTTKGFIAIASTLKKILMEGASACSCKTCERVGDAIIALDAPRTMQLEHTDHSYDYLCPPLRQPHQKHPSEDAVVAKGHGAPATFPTDTPSEGEVDDVGS